MLVYRLFCDLSLLAERRAKRADDYREYYYLSTDTMTQLLGAANDLSKGSGRWGDSLR